MFKNKKGEKMTNEETFTLSKSLFGNNEYTIQSSLEDTVGHVVLDSKKNLPFVTNDLYRAEFRGEVSFGETPEEATEIVLDEFDLAVTKENQ